MYTLIHPSIHVLCCAVQVLDEARGPITRKEYELMQAPAGESLYGAVVNYIGQPISDIATPANTAHIARHRAAAAAGGGGGASAAADAAAVAAAAGAAAAAPSPPPMMTSWEDEDGPDVEGSGVSALGLERLKPLINQQVAMKNREQVTEPLFTGE